jgi:hypothetical protein
MTTQQQAILEARVIGATWFHLPFGTFGARTPRVAVLGAFAGQLLAHIYTNIIAHQHAPSMASMSGRNASELNPLGQYDTRHSFSRGSLSGLIAMMPKANDRADCIRQSVVCALRSNVYVLKKNPLVVICTVAMT